MDENTSRRGIAGAIIPATAFILPPLAVFAPLGAAPLLAVAAPLLLITDSRRVAAGIAALRPLAILLGALALWASASALWSILPQHSLFEGLRFLALSAGGLVILGAGLTAQSVERRRAGLALTIGLMLAIALLLVERFGNEPLTRLWLGASSHGNVPLERFDRGVTVLVLAFWAAAFAPGSIWRRGMLAAALIGTAAVMSSTSALLALVVSLLVFAMARFAARFAASVMIAGTLGLGIAIPLATPYYDYNTVVTLHERAPWIKWSGIHRLVIWRFGAERAAERPILGWGMDASRAIPGGKNDISTLVPALHYPGGAESLPLHPHDAALQWQLELGLPGLLLGLAIIVWAIWHIGWRTPLEPSRRAGALALAAACLTVGMLSFGVWQAWWLSTLWLVTAFYIATGTDGESRPERAASPPA
jgi:O-antigen ligase